MRLSQWSFQGCVIKLAVGKVPDTSIPRIIYVHEHVPRATSQFFKNATKSVWENIRDGPSTIDLSDDDFEVVHAYINWLYTGNVPIQEGLLPGDILTFLVHMYVFGEKIMDVKFKNEIIDHIIAAQKQTNISPGWKQLNEIYTGTVDGSAARRLLVDFVVNLAHDSDEWKAAIINFSEAVMADVLVAMVEARPVPKRKNFESCRSTYHGQESGGNA